ncbi:MAG: hypothetical protein WD231_04620 [Candidatus Woykebacteria bacterium]
MDTLQILLIGSIFLNLIVLLLLFSLYQTQRNLADLTPFLRRILKLRNRVVGKEKKVLSEALEESKDTVEETLEELKSVEDVGEQMRQELNAKAEALVRDTISKDSEVFQNIINTITESYKKEFENLAQVQNSEFGKVVAGAKSSIQLEIGRLREELIKATIEERGKVNQELSSYKEKVKNDLDQKIFLVVSDVARETIEQSVDTGKHEELVLKALERAKNERFL